MKITVKDIEGVVGIVPTPATANAGRWDADNTINIPETEKMVRIVIDAGIDVVMTTGTFGECATLTWDELRDFVACVVQTVRRSRPVFAGVTTLNTRDTIRRARGLLDVGADGLFLGRPMWLAMDDRAIVRYYRDLAAALPGVPMVVYDNPFAFKGKISQEVYRQLADIPEIVAAKHVGGPALEADVLAVGKRMRILPLVTEWYGVALAQPDLVMACWSGGVACAPAPIAALSRAILGRDWSLAQTISDKLKWAEAPMFPGGDLARFMDYSIQLGHLRFASAGLIDPGPSRPPYIDVPDGYAAGAIECGRRWAGLQKEFQRGYGTLPAQG
jgi:4-(2-carboxyphenyl)-2-oxobut-3-enoate aldolase